MYRFFLGGLVFSKWPMLGVFSKEKEALKFLTIDSQPSVHSAFNEKARRRPTGFCRTRPCGAFEKSMPVEMDSTSISPGGRAVSSQKLRQSNSNRKALWHVWKSGAVVLVGWLQSDIFCWLWASLPGHFTHLCLDVGSSWSFYSDKESGRIRREASRPLKERQPAAKKGAQLKTDPTPSKTFYGGT